MAKTKIIYIVGAGRSGTTVLDNILGQVDGFFSGGELAHIWKRGFVQNRLCGCGVPFGSCGVWRAITSKALGGVSLEQAELLAGQVPRTREMQATGRPWSSRRFAARHVQLSGAIRRLYPAILEITGNEIVVDSSKTPSYAYLLAGVPDFEVHVVHMVRDPRAVAFSWARKKLSPSKGPNQYMRTHGPANAAIFWNVWNLQAEGLGSLPIASYTQLRYEDFIASPSGALKTIVRLVGGERVTIPPISNGRIVIHPTHTVSGNPSRFQTGSIELRLDSAWQAELEVRRRWVVNVLAGPFMGRFGYRLRD
jgi:hypothetical protein